MYSLILRYENQSFYAYKDKWRINTKGTTSLESRIISKEEIEDILNEHLLRKIAESKEENKFREQNSLNLEIAFIYYREINSYKAWNGKLTPCINVNNWRDTLFKLQLKNPRCFEIKLIRDLLTGNYKVYMENEVIDFSLLIAITSESTRMIWNINNCYQDIIQSVEADKREILSKKRINIERK